VCRCATCTARHPIYGDRGIAEHRLGRVVAIVIVAAAVANVCECTRGFRYIFVIDFEKSDSAVSHRGHQ